MTGIVAEEPTVLGRLVLSTEATVEGKTLLLTACEERVLRTLMASPGRLATYASLMDAIYPDREADTPPSNTLQVFVSRLRLKLDRAGAHISISTVRSRGYMIEAVDPLPGAQA